MYRTLHSEESAMFSSTRHTHDRQCVVVTPLGEVSKRKDKGTCTELGHRHRHTGADTDTDEGRGTGMGMGVHLGEHSLGEHICGHIHRTHKQRRTERAHRIKPYLGFGGLIGSADLSARRTFGRPKVRFNPSPPPPLFWPKNWPEVQPYLRPIGWPKVRPYFRPAESPV